MANEVTTYGKYTKEQLLAMSGQLVGGNGNLMPNLYINRQAVDRDTEEQLPVEVYCVDTKDHGRVYAQRKKALVFRPYVRKFRYEVYDSKEDATVARTILFGNFKEEIIADNGKLKAGATKEGQPLNLPSTQKAKCKLYVFGTVSFSGITTSGKEVEIADHPCYIKFGGKGLFEEYESTFKKMDYKQKLMFLYDLNITVNRTNKYPVAAIEWVSMTNEHPFTDQIAETLEVFNTYINTENKRITAKWDMVTKHNAKPEEIADKTVVDPEDALANDLKEDVVDEA